MSGTGGEDTIVAAATPPGLSALALVRASGPLCPTLAREALGLADPVPRQATRASLRDRDGAVVDDVIAILYRQPASATGEDVLEVSCHGNPLIVRKIVDDWCVRGCRMAEPGEFTRRALENGRLDLAQAESVLDVIHARTDRELAAAQAQLSGRLGAALESIRTSLVQTVARCEAYLDFPEEDLDPEDVQAVDRELAGVLVALEQLRATEACGRLLRDGVRVVLAGAPNVGKSSLLNALSGEERALVHEEPGTTRDFLEQVVVWEGWRVLLTDTAGLRETTHPVELAGVERTRRWVAEADIVVAVRSVDAPHPPLLVTRADAVVVSVMNKMDACPSDAASALAAGSACLAVSARTGVGLDKLRAAIVEAIGGAASAGLTAEFCVNARHAAALSEAGACIVRARQRLAGGVSDVILAQELRCALEALGRVTGRVELETVLDALFSRFCIGK